MYVNSSYCSLSKFNAALPSLFPTLVLCPEPTNQPLQSNAIRIARNAYNQKVKRGLRAFSSLSSKGTLYLDTKTSIPFLEQRGWCLSRQARAAARKE